MSKYDLVDKPHCIYNVDEKGACPNKTPYLRGAGNAVGTQIPHFLVYPGTRMRSELLDNCKLDVIVV
ncbi:hypothetical protein KUTeg_018742 [Tegillarca granosa]|uniref:Uncharacterized protein n=1 Tax=Tegillarca granosa TaxID=220873 RepID=A0ABQ9EEW1_TEGGR|nr:hypothetical protein KUTeg_018742 [Tegillarca granosa]